MHSDLLYGTAFLSDSSTVLYSFDHPFSLKPIHYIQNQSSFIFMVYLSSRNSINIIRLVNLGIFQVAPERLFPVLHSS